MSKDKLIEAIEELEVFPLSEEQIHLVNYLKANIDDIEVALNSEEN